MIKPNVSVDVSDANSIFILPDAAEPVIEFRILKRQVAMLFDR